MSGTSNLDWDAIVAEYDGKCAVKPVRLVSPLQ